MGVEEFAWYDWRFGTKILTSEGTPRSAEVACLEGTLGKNTWFVWCPVHWIRFITPKA